MTIAGWPTDLPQELLQAGYNHTTADVALRTSMDAGPGKVRRRTTQNVQVVKGAMKLTFAQLTTLRTFFDTTLAGGTLRFAAADPITLLPKEFRFTAPISWTMSNGLFNVSFEFEILP